MNMIRRDAAHPSEQGGWGHFRTEAWMAPANIAAASDHRDSIKGLAQSIAKPAYRRLLFAEPALRRAVPILIIAFLVTIAIGASVQVLDHRSEDRRVGQRCRARAAR